MSELEITPRRILSVWWLLVWRAIVFGGGVGALAGLIYGVAMVLAGYPKHSPWGAAVLGYLFGIPMSFIVVRMALRKRYRGFRIALVPIDAP